VRIDRDEQPFTPRKNLILLIENLRRVGVIPSPNPHLPRFHSQRFVQRNRLQVIDANRRGQRDHVPQLVHLSHRLIQNGRDDSAMRVTRRPGIAFAQAKPADEAVPVFVIAEFEAHAVGIVLPASEAVVLLQANVARVVTLGGRFLRHAAVILS